MTPAALKQLGDAVCEGLGVEPRRYLVASKDGGFSSALHENAGAPWYGSVSAEDVREWCLRHPPYLPVEVSAYPAVSASDGCAVETLVPAVHAHGWRLGIQTASDLYMVKVRHGDALSLGTVAMRLGHTLREALILATAAALGIALPTEAK